MSAKSQISYKMHLSGKSWGRTQQPNRQLGPDTDLGLGGGGTWRGAGSWVAASFCTVVQNISSPGRSVTVMRQHKVTFPFCLSTKTRSLYKPHGTKHRSPGHVSDGSVLSRCSCSAAPVCPPCGEGYTKTPNQRLVPTSKQHSIQSKPLLLWT